MKLIYQNDSAGNPVSPYQLSDLVNAIEAGKRIRVAVTPLIHSWNVTGYWTLDTIWINPDGNVYGQHTTQAGVKVDSANKDNLTFKDPFYIWATIVSNTGTVNMARNPLQSGAETTGQFAISWYSIDD